MTPPTNAPSHRGFLAEVLAAEVDERVLPPPRPPVARGPFPRMQRLEDFDCTVAPGVPPTTVAALQAGAIRRRRPSRGAGRRPLAPARATC
jgi:hypothetical protein